jgi:thiol:disulfide interchange protein
MKLRFLTTVLFLGCFATSQLKADPEYPKMGADIFDVHADAKEQIAAAVAQAALTHKTVLLDFGANWCIWCHRLHTTFEKDPAVAKSLSDGFVVVMVDVNTRRGEKRNADVVNQYGNPIAHGIPVLVVLDSTGKQLTTKDSGELEDGEGHSPAKITAFLALWAPAAHP